MRRRVHHVGPDPAFVGGIGSVISVLCEHDLGSARAEALASWRPTARLWGLVPALSAAVRIVRAPREELVHVHLAEGGAFLREGALLALSRLRGHPTVATIHGSRFIGFAAHRGRLARAVLRSAHVITCLSEDVCAVASMMAPRAHVALLANPVALDPSARSAELTDELVLFAGEIGTRKGADVLREAWLLLAAARPRARCIMVGPIAGAPPAAAERLEVRPPIARAQVRALLRKARVVALPSRAEGMPMILTEAMACARPFVATPVGGVRSLLPGGLLVPVEDPVALAGALESLLEAPELAGELGALGRANCEETRSPGVIGARLGALYSEAMRRSGIEAGSAEPAPRRRSAETT